MDDRYRFPPHEDQPLCEWLPTVLLNCPSWPLDVALFWDERPDFPVAGSPPWRCEPSQRVLRVGPGMVIVNGCMMQGLVARWDEAFPGESGVTSQLPPRSFTTCPGDLFDALALALAQRSAVAMGAFPRHGTLTGMTLREELADWMRTKAGRLTMGPWLATDASFFGWEERGAKRPRLLAPDPRPAVSAAGSGWQGASLQALPAPQALQAEMANPVHLAAPRTSQVLPQTPWQDPWQDSWQDPLQAASQATSTSLMAQPSWPVDSLHQAIHTLRSGGWSHELDHLVPTLLSRLPGFHPWHVEGMRVNHAGREMQCGKRTTSSSEVTLYRRANGHLEWCDRKRQPSACPPGPDSFLEAALEIPFGKLKTQHPRLRAELAEVMAANPMPMRIRLALHERDFPGDHEILMRLCLVNNEPTPAGQQLLDPSRPQRSVGRTDLMRWFHSTASSLLRTPENLARDGISVLDAHRVASPLRLTLAGNALKGCGRGGHVPPLPLHAAELLALMLPGLLYAYRTNQSLLAYLRVTEYRLKSLLPPEALPDAHRLKDDAMEAESLDIPVVHQGSHVLP
ncbi:hypothetical protein [Roseateles terrae]|uniref:Uncharacterized protein n=1 Tax=Roseateles terrae TaxID=431060 RepID=A0ABR6GQI0_9BURK|nr:hypothetical protein [Roseateles terrae]MBB3194366.1 hypothetical protein [Roseateles terrae]OWQ88200.1 hypothetical protein CDN98_08720 [Roseateles terrae]